MLYTHGEEALEAKGCCGSVSECWGATANIKVKLEATIEVMVQQRLKIGCCNVTIYVNVRPMRSV